MHRMGRLQGSAALHGYGNQPDGDGGRVSQGAGPVVAGGLGLWCQGSQGCGVGNRAVVLGELGLWCQGLYKGIIMDALRHAQW